MTCDHDCTCRGRRLSLVLSPDDPGYDEAVQRALNLVAELEASKQRHPTNQLFRTE